MKKRTISIVAVSLAMAVANISLTGCGTQARATDAALEDEEIIVVNEGDEAAIDDRNETSGNVADGEEVIGDFGAETKEEIGVEASYTEHEYFFALDEQDSSTEEELDLSTLEPDGRDFVLKESVTLYGSGRAVVIGYTKPDINVYVVTSSEDWFCVEFKDEDPEYQLVLVKKEDFINSSGMNDGITAVTYGDVEFALKDNLYSSDYGVDYDVFFGMLDAPEEDMESAEFIIPVYCTDVSGWMAQVISDNHLGNYCKFYMEQLEDMSDDENLCFRIYYGELQKFAK